MMSIRRAGPSALDSAIILADGENLVLRYQAMLKEKNRVNPTVKHIQDVFVWHPNISSAGPWQPIRVNYYASMVGTDEKIAKAELEISQVLFGRRQGEPTQICPRIFKKAKDSYKTRIVDINITIDALRHSYHRHVDTIFLLSGDGDYGALIEEVMRQGIQVWLGAFSSGLDKRLPRMVDKFVNLDSWFFYSEEPPNRG